MYVFSNHVKSIRCNNDVDLILLMSRLYVLKSHYSPIRNFDAMQYVFDAIAAAAEKDQTTQSEGSVMSEARLEEAINLLLNDSKPNKTAN